MEIPKGRGVLEAKFLEAMWETKLEFPGGKRGGGMGAKIDGGSMDIFLELHISGLLKDREENSHLLGVGGG